MVSPGVVMGDIDKAARKRLTELGYGDYIRHGTGHAHGIMIGQTSREEFGELREYNRRAFEVGMASSVEPGIFLPGLGAFRHSDVLVVTDRGAECVTDFDVMLDMSNA
jgi:Xaa-Pro aminopeptidase